ncbi:MAG TPA: hypothetical protein VMV68_01005 [Spirochaetia bacterium]|nr:hypothetical protein [Spirochaetia bacterium]
MDFIEKVQSTLTQGLESSRELFGKAREKAKDLGEKGVLHFEVMQLERQAADLMGKLGTRVFDVLNVQKQNTVSAKTEGVKELIQEIENVRKLIEQKEAELKSFG